MRKTFLIVHALIILTNFFGYSQNNAITDTSDNKIMLYLDCDDCDFSFFRRNISYVNFVRDPKVAEIHVFVTTQKTASNSTRYTVNFLGLNHYSDLNYNLRTISPETETDILQWERLLKIIKTGLLPFISRTSEFDKININHNEEETNPKNNKNRNFWVFRLQLASDFEEEESQKEYSINNNFKADRITEIWKFKTDLEYNFKKEKYDDDNEIIESTREQSELDIECIYSINPKWSAGLFGEVSSSSYLNLNFASEIGPAIEYNIFPWDESDSKVFTIAYNLEAKYFNYNDLTIFDKTREWKTSQELSLSLILRQPWGEIENKLEGSHFLDDFSKNNLSLESYVSVNVAKGLSLFVELEAEVIHDQLYLAAGEATKEDLLLKQKKLATSYEIFGEIGIRYTFGALYNNIVNPRLE